MATAGVDARDDAVVEKEIRDAVAGIEMHVTGLEGLISKFYDHTHDDDGGAGLAHLEILSSVFDDLIEGRLQPGWEQHKIWSEKERDSWSPFATQVTDHLYAIPPLLLKIQALRAQTSKPHAFANLLYLGFRITALFEHDEPDPDWVETSRGASHKEDEDAYAAWSEPLDVDDCSVDAV